MYYLLQLVDSFIGVLNWYLYTDFYKPLWVKVSFPFDSSVLVHLGFVSDTQISQWEMIFQLIDISTDISGSFLFIFIFLVLKPSQKCREKDSLSPLNVQK